MRAPTADRTDLVLAAQTGDAGSVKRLLAVAKPTRAAKRAGIATQAMPMMRCKRLC